MRKVERDLDRILACLRNVIRERGYTQRQVQEVLGWGRSYISQLLTQQKSLRFDQVLRILDVIHVKPEDFWREVYPFGETYRRDGLGRPGGHRAPSLPGSRERTTLLSDLRRLRRLVDGLVAVLKQKHLITSRELEDATQRALMNGRH